MWIWLTSSLQDTTVLLFITAWNVIRAVTSLPLHAWLEVLALNVDSQCSNSSNQSAATCIQHSDPPLQDNAILFSKLGGSFSLCLRWTPLGIQSQHEVCCSLSAFLWIQFLEVTVWIFSFRIICSLPVVLSVSGFVDSLVVGET